MSKRSKGRVVCCFWIWSRISFFSYLCFLLLICVVRVDTPLFIMLLGMVVKKLSKFWLNMEQRLIFQAMYFDFIFFLIDVLFWWCSIFFDCFGINYWNVKRDQKGGVVCCFEYQISSHFIFLFDFLFVVSLEIPLFTMLLRKVLKKLSKFWLIMGQISIFETKYFHFITFLIWCFEESFECLNWLILSYGLWRSVSVSSFFFEIFFFFVLGW